VRAAIPSAARARGRRGPALLPALLGFVLAACSGPILANLPAARPSAAPRTPAPAAPADPRPVDLPRDDGPHDRLTEWWYYTGHLAAADGRTFGFEYVVFRAERGGFPVSWASHLAVTDESANRFAYGQRGEIGPQVDRSPRDASGSPSGFALALFGVDPTHPASNPGTAWTMGGSGGRDSLSAALGPQEAAATPMPRGFGLRLALGSLRPPALHGHDGWVDFGAAGGSYYYSRTRMTAAGTLTVDGERVPVSGTAWFDHQWGDFIAVGGGGWDWFAVNLDDGTDLTVSLVRSADGTYPLVYGTLVRPDGTSRPVARGEISVEAVGRWTSARSGATYPSGWRVRVSGATLDLVVVPTLPDQELDTRATTGVVYWEGSQRITGTRAGRPVTGKAYVELTGYAGGAVAAP
jgi:predicted secreted hydrolase